MPQIQIQIHMGVPLEKELEKSIDLLFVSTCYHGQKRATVYDVRLCWLVAYISHLPVLVVFDSLVLSMVRYQSPYLRSVGGESSLPERFHGIMRHFVHNSCGVCTKCCHCTCSKWRQFCINAVGINHINRAPQT